MNDSPTVVPKTEASTDLRELVAGEGEELSVKAFSVESEDLQLAEEIAGIPQKMAFKIGEVAEMAAVKQYVLRYWESEFEVLKPKKSSRNQRMYSRKDVETVFLIKKLLYRDRFSISGARSAIGRMKKKVQREKQTLKSVQKYQSALERTRGLVAELKSAAQRF